MNSNIDSLIELVNQCAKVPSFTTYEDRILCLVEKYVSHLPVTITQIPESNCILSWVGNRTGRPIAITAHLDKINHFSNLDIDELPVTQDSDEIVGQLDDAVGVAICLHVLSECMHIRNCPPIMILLSEMEETYSLHRPDLLRNGGAGIKLTQGAQRISDYIITQKILPEAVITIDTSAVFRKTGGVALYTEFWEQACLEPTSQLLGKTTELANRIHNIDIDVRPANGVNDYITYGMRLNEPNDVAIPSIAIEPAIFPIHAIGERMKVADIYRVNKIILELVRTWPQ